MKLYLTQKVSRYPIDNLNVKTNLAYGRMIIEKSFQFLKIFFNVTQM